MPAGSSGAVRAGWRIGRSLIGCAPEACRGRPRNRARSRHLVLAILFPDVGRSHLLFRPRGAGDLAARLPSRSSAPHNKTMRNCQLTTCYNGNNCVLTLPCRFPAKLAILAAHCSQGHDHTKFFSTKGAAKKFLSEFSLCGRERRGGATRRPSVPLAPPPPAR